MPPEVIAPAAPSPAPAPPAAAVPEPLSAVEQAVVAKDPIAYKAARHAENTGTPLPPKAAAAPASPVPTDDDPDDLEAVAPVAAPVAPVVEPPARQLSKRQQDTNAAIRSAVDAATSALQAENARLRAQVTPPPAAPRTPAPTADLEPDVANKEAYPDGQFDPKFIKDLASWQTRQDLKAYGDRTDADARQHAAVTQFQTRADATRGIVQAAIAADPKALDGIDPALHLLKPTLALAPGEAPTFGNVVADWLTDTQYPVQLLHHLSDRAEQVRLSNLSDAAFLREQGRLEAGFALKATPPAPAPPAKLITEAPDPAHTLGSRPLDAPDAIEGAVRSKDQAAYSAAKRAKGLLHYSA